jgi:hypothetical protein
VERCETKGEGADIVDWDRRVIPAMQPDDLIGILWLVGFVLGAENC